MKRTLIALLLVFLITSFPAYSIEPLVEYRVIHENTPMLKEPTADLDNEVICRLPANAVVLYLLPVTTASAKYIKCSYNGITGYINQLNIYNTTPEKTYRIVDKKTKSTKLGDKILIFSLDGKKVLDKYEDGIKVNVVLDDSSFVGYSKIIYLDGFGLIKNDNLTDTISTNESVALILFAVCGTAGILITLLVLLRKKIAKKNI